MKSDSQFPYSFPVFLQFKISFPLICAYPLMTSNKMPIRQLKVYGNVSSVFVSYVCANVHFLHFGELKMQFLHITPCVYR